MDEANFPRCTTNQKHHPDSGSDTSKMSAVFHATVLTNVHFYFLFGVNNRQSKYHDVDILSIIVLLKVQVNKFSVLLKASSGFASRSTSLTSHVSCL